MNSCEGRSKGLVKNIPPVTVIMNEDESKRFDEWVTGKRACFTKDCPTNGKVKCEKCLKGVEKARRLMREVREGKLSNKKEGN